MRKYCDSKNKIIKELYDIYILDGIDIFNYEASSQNKITYHHIIKVEDLKLLEFPTKKTIEKWNSFNKNWA